MPFGMEIVCVRVYGFKNRFDDRSVSQSLTNRRKSVTWRVAGRGQTGIDRFAQQIEAKRSIAWGAPMFFVKR